MDSYTQVDIHGFSVFINDSTWMNDSLKTEEVLDVLDIQLGLISSLCLDSEAIDFFQSVAIFINWNHGSTAAQYHPHHGWLVANGYIPDMEMAVEISNMTSFVHKATLNQPYLMLHELSHAYHHQVLDFNHVGIQMAYDSAMADSLYYDVEYTSGYGTTFQLDSAYARTNFKEYFAELTEAYLGINEYEPFNYDSLQSYDTLGFRILSEIWGDPQSACMEVDECLAGVDLSDSINDESSTIHQANTLLGNDHFKLQVPEDGILSISSGLVAQPATHSYLKLKSDCTTIIAEEGSTPGHFGATSLELELSAGDSIYLEWSQVNNQEEFEFNIIFQSLRQGRSCDEPIYLTEGSAWVDNWFENQYFSWTPSSDGEMEINLCSGIGYSAEFNVFPQSDCQLSQQAQLELLDCGDEERAYYTQSIVAGEEYIVEFKPRGFGQFEDYSFELEFDPSHAVGLSSSTGWGDLFNIHNLNLYRADGKLLRPSALSQEDKFIPKYQEVK